MDYDARKQAEMFHYVHVESQNPELIRTTIQDYWDEKWTPIFRAGGFMAGENMFVTAVRKQCLAKPNQIVQVVSFGTGESHNEISLAQELMKAGIRNFAIECVEFNPELCDQVRGNLVQLGLDQHLTIITQDMNQWTATRTYDVVMAAWCLHHFVELEYIFDQIHSHLADDGEFVTADVIGRNGHQRWPEVWPVLLPLWQNLPDKYKVNHQLGTLDIEKPWDDDCAAGNFEGIRAQDILPLLMERFHFHQFSPYGNLAEKFFEKNYGPNYSPQNPDDTAIVDKVAALDELLIDVGVITPVRMNAVLGKNPVANPKYYKEWTPEYVVRDPSAEIHRRRISAPSPAPASVGQPAVSIIMAVESGFEQTLAALESLLSNAPRATEIVVVDNASGDPRTQQLGQLGGNLKLVALSNRVAAADAWEQGLGATSGSAVVFMSNDIRPTEGWFEPLDQELQADKRTALSPILVSGSGIRSTSQSFDSFKGVCLAASREALTSSEGISARICTRSTVGTASELPAFAS